MTGDGGLWDDDVDDDWDWRQLRWRAGANKCGGRVNGSCYVWGYGAEMGARWGWCYEMMGLMGCQIQQMSTTTTTTALARRLVQCKWQWLNQANCQMQMLAKLRQWQPKLVVQTANATADGGSINAGDWGNGGRHGYRRDGLRR